MHLRKRFGAHADDDRIVPIGAAALNWAKRAKNTILKIDLGASHGLAYTPMT